MQGSEQLIGIFHIGFIVCLILAILFAGLSIFLFFYLRIKEVFNFLTGRAQKRSIQQMEEENAKTGKLRSSYHTTPTSSELYTTPSGRIPPQVYSPHKGDSGQFSGRSKTESMTALDMEGKSRTAPLDARKTEDIYPDNGSGATTLLNSGSEETTLLNSGSEETMLLNGRSEDNMLPDDESGETEVLNDGCNETTLLHPAMRRTSAEEAKSVRKFVIRKEIMEIHTEETI